MTKYQIEILRTEYKSKTFTVTADNRREAVEKALDQAADISWLDASASSADYEVESVEPQEETINV